jgi:hypothetical protein
MLAFRAQIRCAAGAATRRGAARKQVCASCPGQRLDRDSSSASIWRRSRLRPARGCPLLVVKAAVVVDDVADAGFARGMREPATVSSVLPVAVIQEPGVGSRQCWIHGQRQPYVLAAGGALRSNDRPTGHVIQSLARRLSSSGLKAGSTRVVGELAGDIAPYHPCSATPCGYLQPPEPSRMPV